MAMEANTKHIILCFKQLTQSMAGHHQMHIPYLIGENLLNIFDFSNDLSKNKI